MPNANINQQIAIQSRANRITVDASAGTGKTWVLSQRYFSILLQDELTPNDILTLTFTQAAANDMKKRIQNRFPDSKSEISASLAQSWISTIHAFASRLLKQSGLSLDLDPTASVISPRQQSDFWLSIRLALAYSNLHSLTASHEKFLNDTAKFLDSNSTLSAAVNKWGAEFLTRLAEDFSDLHASRGLSWREVLANSDEPKLIERAKIPVTKILSKHWEQIYSNWQNIHELPEPNPKSKGYENARMFNEILNHHDDFTPRDFYTKLTSKNLRASTGEPFKSLKEFLGVTFGVWRSSQPKRITKITQNLDTKILTQELELRSVLIKFCALCWGIWDITKRRRGIMSFSDMISHALQAIEEGAVTKNFAHILVDEFQDTDPLQYRMICALADQSENNSFFAVGDPKQSIYRFRHAEPELFAQAIDAASERVTLDVSFRTRPSLLERINRIFGSIWKHSLGNSAAMSKLSYKRIQPAEISPERNNGTMKDFETIFQVKYDSDSVKNLALKLAQKVRTCVDNKLTIWDKDSQMIRPIEFADFAVLCRSRTHYEILEEAFASFAIKTIQDRSTGYFGRGEVSDIISMLRACADFNDDASVAGWLMSPFSGANESDALRILKLRSQDSNRKIISILEQELPEIFHRLEHLALIGEIKGAASVIEIFDRDRSWLTDYKFENRLRIIRNLRQAISIAMSFQEGGVSGLSACSEWLGRAMSGGVTLDEPSWRDKNENAVSLISIHGSKGLEYPAVAIFETKTTHSEHYDNLRASRELGLVFSDIPDEMKPEIFDSESDLQISDWDKLLNEQGEREEDLRLFYVAATRAQDSLIFCSLLKESGEAYENSWAKILFEHAAEYMQDSEPESESKIQIQMLDKPDNTQDLPNLQRVNLARINTHLRQISATSFSLYEFCGNAWRRKYLQGINLTWESPEKDFANDDNSEFFGGADIGSLAHWVLSKINLKSGDHESEIAKLLNSRESLNHLPVKLRGVWRDESVKKILTVWLLRFFASPEGVNLLRHSGDLKRESAFRIELGNLILAGSIDVLYQEQDFYKLLDYKTTLSDNAPDGLYESQMDFYAFALSRCVKNPTCKIKTGIVFLREGKYLEREYSERDCENIRERIIIASKNCLLENQKHNHNCEKCPFRKGCKNHE